MIDDFRPTRNTRSAKPAPRIKVVQKPAGTAKRVDDFAPKKATKAVVQAPRMTAQKTHNAAAKYVVSKSAKIQNKPVTKLKKSVVTQTTTDIQKPLTEPELPKKVVIEKHIFSKPDPSKQPKSLTLVLSLFLLVLFVVPTGLVLRNWWADREDEQNVVSTQVPAQNQEAPFVPLYPAGLATQASDTPTYDFSEKLLRFTDRVGDVPVAVSQQTLPENFRADSSGVEFEKFAKAEGATRSFKAGSYAFYLGSRPGAANLVHLTDQKVMVTITSQVAIDPILWTEYLATYQPEAATD